jgi:hypothetical protein
VPDAYAPGTVLGYAAFSVPLRASLNELNAFSRFIVARPVGAVIGITGRKIEVDPSIRPAVRAQRALRLGAAASLEDPLLPYATKTLSYALTDATNDVGVTAHGRLAERQTLAPLAWLKKLGITIRELP